MAVENNEIKYPGPEGFWRQSPKLIELQDDLNTVWQELEEAPSFPEEELTSKSAGDLIAIHTKNLLYESYEVFELGTTPRIEDRYPRKPFQVTPRVSSDPMEAQIIINVEKWPSGYRVSGAPVTSDYDWAMFVHQGEATYKQVTEPVRARATRLAALNEMDRAERRKQDPEALGREQRILDIVKKSS